jgi:hypothetical protein
VKSESKEFDSDDDRDSTSSSSSTPYKPNFKQNKILMEKRRSARQKRLKNSALVKSKTPVKNKIPKTNDPDLINAHNTYQHDWKSLLHYHQRRMKLEVKQSKIFTLLPEDMGLGLFLLRSVKKGETISPYWGDYRTSHNKIPKERLPYTILLSKYMDSYQGTGKGLLYLVGKKNCPATYANASMYNGTQTILDGVVVQSNAELFENGNINLSSNYRVVIRATKDIIFKGQPIEVFINHYWQGKRKDI